MLLKELICALLMHSIGGSSASSVKSSAKRSGRVVSEKYGHLQQPKIKNKPLVNKNYL